MPELYVKELQRWPTVVTAEDNATVLPGITAHIAPGHTPGCLAFLLRGKDSDVIFTGDAAKNRAELVSGTTDMTYDAAVSRATIDMIWKVWRMRPGSIVVPGHDLPMVLDGDRTPVPRQARGRHHLLVRRRPRDHHPVRADHARRQRRHPARPATGVGRISRTPDLIRGRWRRRAPILSGQQLNRD